MLAITRHEIWVMLVYIPISLDDLATNGCAMDVLQPQNLSWTYSIGKPHVEKICFESRSV